MKLTRRSMLQAMAASAGLSVGGLSWAGAPPDARLLVLLLRGGMDGLDAVRPVGDRHYRALRDEHGGGDAFSLDDTFALHPALSPLAPLYTSGQLLVVHAAGLPYEQRSHFDAQDMLENGTSRPRGARSGWLNRALTAMGASDRDGLALGGKVPLLLRGDTPVVAVGESGGMPAAESLIERVSALYEEDALLGPLLAEGLAGRDMLTGSASARRSDADQQLVRMAARLLMEEDGPRVAVLETSNWDTHSNQFGERGRLGRALGQLAGRLAELPQRVAPIWDRTVVLAVTEFGRSARPNGTGGTDHGSGGALFLLGGPVKGGRVIADWPGLSDRDLLDGRDLRPTTDVRAVFKGVLGEHLGIDRAALERDIFPESADVAPLSGLV